MTLNSRLLRALILLRVIFLVLRGISIEAKLSIALRELRITILKLSPRILFMETIVTLTSWLLVADFADFGQNLDRSLGQKTDLDQNLGTVLHYGVVAADLGQSDYHQLFLP